MHIQESKAALALDLPTWIVADAVSAMGIDGDVGERVIPEAQFGRLAVVLNEQKQVELSRHDIIRKLTGAANE